MSRTSWWSARWPSPLATLLETIYDKPTLLTMAGLILTGIPGVFGFLAWELKENWKLYAANRSPTLQPVPIGRHGETLRRLLAPGFHSGTIPRLFTKRRRAARQAGSDRNVDRQVRFAEKLNHEAEGLRHFIERELLGLLEESRTFRQRSLSVGRVELATNRVQVLVCEQQNASEPVVIQFCEQSGWIVAAVADLGWLRDITEEDRTVFRAALAGLYKRGAAGLVREQIETQLVAAPLPTAQSLAGPVQPDFEQAAPPTHPYDVSFRRALVWPYGHFESAVKYSLEDGPQTSPRPRSLARAAGLAPLPLVALVYQEHPLAWNDWARLLGNRTEPGRDSDPAAAERGVAQKGVNGQARPHVRPVGVWQGQSGNSCRTSSRVKIVSLFMLGWSTIHASDGPDRVAEAPSFCSLSSSSGPSLSFRLRRFGDHCHELLAAP